MPISYIRPLTGANREPFYADVIPHSPGSPPPRPTPGPEPEFPVDPGYGVDEGTGPVYPTHPIVIPPPKPPTDVDPIGTAIVLPYPDAPEGQPNPKPPEGMPSESTLVLLWFGRGTIPVPVWVPPYVSHNK
jgi:hypothetical protein